MRPAPPVAHAEPRHTRRWGIIGASVLPIRAAVGRPVVVAVRTAVDRRTGGVTTIRAAVGRRSGGISTIRAAVGRRNTGVMIRIDAAVVRRHRGIMVRVRTASSVPVGWSGIVATIAGAGVAPVPPLPSAGHSLIRLSGRHLRVVEQQVQPATQSQLAPSKVRWQPMKASNSSAVTSGAASRRACNTGTPAIRRSFRR